MEPGWAGTAAGMAFPRPVGSLVTNTRVRDSCMRGLLLGEEELWDYRTTPRRLGRRGGAP
ncbi:hypothetical protein HDA39_005405 [Kribbella italica]|uniref:Uncharacterized protein n=1 Tax=Kribbella italica TaxID=1540520 RepID=A0A7W9JAM1_9ACTN|nr:hypothetical protein [Kribbella italica]